MMRRVISRCPALVPSRTALPVYTSFPSLCKPAPTLKFARHFSNPLSQFELLEDESGSTRAQALSATGFLVNDVVHEGSVVLLTKLVLSFRPRTVEELTVESLSLLPFLQPAPDLVLIGTGERIILLPDELVKHYSQLGIVLEALSTFHALSTFNVLNQEGRNVAAVLLPKVPYPADT